MIKGSDNPWVCTELLLWIHFVWTRPRLYLWLNLYATSHWRSLGTLTVGPGPEKEVFISKCVWELGRPETGQVAPNYFLSLFLSSSTYPTLTLGSPFPISVHVHLPPEGNMGTGVRFKMAWNTKGKNGPVSSISLEVQSPLRKVAVIFLGTFAHCPCFQLQVELLGHGQPLTWASSKPNGITVELPHLSFRQMPCKWGWTLALTNVT